MHQVWDKLLDDEFVATYKHGFTMECLDGVWRRFYPRIFTYSADYPEKCVTVFVWLLILPFIMIVTRRVLIATVRSRGICPCPRCLVAKVDLHKVGQIRDSQNRLSNARHYMGDVIRRARDFIYKLGLNVAGAAVERLLFAHSWVPTLVRLAVFLSFPHSHLKQNTFAEKLGPYGFDPFAMLVVDLMHEFELGVWKAIFAHLVRILYAATPAGRMVTELDRRYYVCFLNSNTLLTSILDFDWSRHLVEAQSDGSPIMRPR
jgi:hypothetical protein